MMIALINARIMLESFVSPCTRRNPTQGPQPMRGQRSRFNVVAKWPPLRSRARREMAADGGSASGALPRELLAVDSLEALDDRAVTCGIDEAIRVVGVAGAVLLMHAEL